MYPATNVDSVAPSIHDVNLVQGLFANDANFCSSTSFEVFEMEIDGNENTTGSWKTITGDPGMGTFLQASAVSLYMLVILRNLRGSGLVREN